MRCSTRRCGGWAWLEKRRRPGLRDLGARAARRAWAGLTTWPDASGWALSALIGLATLGAIGLIGFGTGLYRLTPPMTDGLALRLVETFIAPAIGEEVFFRGLLIPDRFERSRFVPALALSESLFIAWHVVEAELILPSARAMFLRPDFLTIAGLLGLACAFIRRVTGSLWPAILLHWVMVTLWQTFAGGFRM